LAVEWAVVMPKQRDSLRKRLARAIERVRKPHPLLALLGVREPTIELDYSDQRTRAIHATLALTLPDRHTDSPLQKAFDAFGLDPNDPHNWRRLLDEFANILFGEPARGRGHPVKWDEARRSQFEIDAAEARQRLRKIAAEHGLPPPTNEDIAEYLRWKWPERYASFNWQTLRRYIASGPPRTKRSKRVRNK
jgi:hypothetical protein